MVEVGGSECLHFMEVEGLLRDGDEVLYVFPSPPLISLFYAPCFDGVCVAY